MSYWGGDAAAAVAAAWLCQLCGREARVFDTAPGRSPRRTCWYECNAALAVVLDEWGGQELMQHNLTQMEVVAVRSARQSLYEALVRIGRAEAFNDASAADMDSVIEAVWNGVRASMQEQTARGDVPF